MVSRWYLQYVHVCQPHYKLSTCPFSPVGLRLTQAWCWAGLGCLTAGFKALLREGERVWISDFLGNSAFLMTAITGRYKVKGEEKERSEGKHDYKHRGHVTEAPTTIKSQKKRVQTLTKILRDYKSTSLQFTVPLIGKYVQHFTLTQHHLQPQQNMQPSVTMYSTVEYSILYEHIGWVPLFNNFRCWFKTWNKTCCLNGANAILGWQLQYKVR